MPVYGAQEDPVLAIGFSRTTANSFFCAPLYIELLTTGTRCSGSEKKPVSHAVSQNVDSFLLVKVMCWWALS